MEIQQDITEKVPEGTSQDAAQVEAAASAKESTPTQEVFTPDWSFKFNDETREVPEDIRSWVKDKEHVEKLKDIYQRAEALDWQKNQTSTFREQSKILEGQLSEYSPIVERVKELQSFYEKGDHERVMAALGYKEQDILDLARKYLEREKMAPEQRQLYEKTRAAELEKEEYSRQTQFYRQQAEQQLAVLTDMQLAGELGKADVQQVAQAYDSKFGAGKFRELVITQGETLVGKLGRHVPPSELVPMIASQFLPFISSQQAAGAAMAPSVQAGAPKPKVIPNVKGNNAAIGRNQITSLDDLKKRRQEVLGGI